MSGSYTDPCSGTMVCALCFTMSHVLHPRHSNYSILTGKTLTLEEGESQLLALGIADCWGAQTGAPISRCEPVLCPDSSRCQRHWGNKIPQRVLHQQKENPSLSSGRAVPAAGWAARVCLCVCAGLSPLHPKASHHGSFTHPGPFRCAAPGHRPPWEHGSLWDAPSGWQSRWDGGLCLVSTRRGPGACTQALGCQQMGAGLLALRQALLWDVPARLSPVFQASSRAVSHGRSMDTSTLLQHM